MGKPHEIRIADAKKIKPSVRVREPGPAVDESECKPKIWFAPKSLVPPAGWELGKVIENFRPEYTYGFVAVGRRSVYISKSLFDRCPGFKAGAQVFVEIQEGCNGERPRVKNILLAVSKPAT